MEKIIQNVEVWKGFIPKENNPYEKELVSHRITTTDGEQYITYRWADDVKLKPYAKYSMKITNEISFSFFNEPKRMYQSVVIGEELPIQTKKKLITDTPTLFDQESPVEPMKMVQTIQTDNMVEYHKLAVDMLWKMEELNLPNLALLAPMMKDICEGKIDKNKLGKLHLELYGKTY